MSRNQFSITIYFMYKKCCSQWRSLSPIQDRQPCDTNRSIEGQLLAEGRKCNAVFCFYTPSGIVKNNFPFRFRFFFIIQIFITLLPVPVLFLPARNVTICGAEANSRGEVWSWFQRQFKFKTIPLMNIWLGFFFISVRLNFAQWLRGLKSSAPSKMSFQTQWNTLRK